MTNQFEINRALHAAKAAMQSGDVVGALRIIEKARKKHPKHETLAGAAGDLALKSGNPEAAAKHFSDASRLAPHNIDHALNHAIALQRLDRHSDALKLLLRREKHASSLAKYASIRALSEKALGHLSDAAKWYDAALGIDPQHPKALHGRARIALERCEADAVQRFDRAISVNSGDADLWLGKAQALDVAGDRQGALTVARQIATQAPSFLAGQAFYAQMRLAAGEANFTSHYFDAASKHPSDPNIPVSHCEVLGGLDHNAHAADVAAAARKVFPQVAHFSLLEAIYAGAAGEWDRADRAFSTVPDDYTGSALHRGRHFIRSKDFAKAGQYLDRAIKEDPASIAAWANQGILWRLTQDERAHWLHEQDGLVQFLPLASRDALIDDLAGELRSLHLKSSMPLGQSLRGGTQTAGILFQRQNPLLEELHEAIGQTLESYRKALPAKDKAHPLLRNRDKAWRLEGSWSVRLISGGDHHSSHIHPQGMLSSALYITIPDQPENDTREGCLELGRPKNDLETGLPPLHTLKPRTGHLALFPSTLYHGTTPFSGSERMTVAFDVVPIT